MLTAGLAGLVAGAMSMAVGEYISVSSQRDAEEADRAVEAEAIAENRMAELHELAKIYEDRGVEPGLARLVADQLMAHDALGAHTRDELGISEIMTARPFQAAWTSATAFTLGARDPGARGQSSHPSRHPHRRDRGRHPARAPRTRRARRATRAAPVDTRRGAASSRGRRSRWLLTYAIGRIVGAQVSGSATAPVPTAQCHFDPAYVPST